MKDLLKSLRRRLAGRPAKHAIILGADYPEFKIYHELTAQGEYQVLFFIDEEPWNHRTKVEEAELRYPSELVSLCENNDVQAVFYQDESLLAKIPEVKVPLIKWPGQ